MLSQGLRESYPTSFRERVTQRFDDIFANVGVSFNRITNEPLPEDAMCLATLPPLASRPNQRLRARDRVN